MFVRDLLRSLLRRWYFVIAGLITTAVLCLGVYQVVPVSYQANASYLMLPPKSTVGTGGNPFLYLGGLGQALDVLSLRVQSAPVSDPILKANTGSSFTTGPDPSTSGPVLLITSVAKSAKTSEATLAAVGEQLPVQLVLLQDDLKVPAPSRIGLLKLATDAKPILVEKSRVQALAAVGALGAVGTILLTGLLDGVLLGRRRRKLEEAAANARGKQHATRSAVSATSSGARSKPRGSKATRRRDVDAAIRPSERELVESERFPDK